jgi:regulatory protein
MPPDTAPSVISIELKGAAGEAVRIHLSDGSFFILHAEIFARTSLAAGSTLDPETRDALCARSEQVMARDRALLLLGRAAQTRRGLARKLSARGFSAQAVRHAVARMVELGYIDDRAFAEAWLRSRLASGKDGANALYRGLLSRGLARPLAEEVLQSMYPVEDEAKAGVTLVRGLSKDAAIHRLTGRGFRSRTIAAVLRRMKERDPEPDGE